MTTRSIINLVAGIVTLFGSALLVTNAGEAAEAAECCYAVCMDYCTDKKDFGTCHGICNGDCNAC